MMEPTKNKTTNKVFNVKFLVAYHKPDIIFKNDMIIPINVGRAILRKRAKNDDAAKKNLEFLESNMIGDDTGDNISEKNSSYNELTALYWAWKNYDKIGNPTHIGLMHYRRHFIFKNLENTFNECNDIGKDYFSEELNFNKEVIEDILEKNDFIAKKPAKFSSVYDAYLANHRPENMSTAISILKELFPEYRESCDKYMAGHDCYYLNMFVFPKQIFFEYCKYMFGILSEFEKRMDTSHMRFFISEFLTGIFIQHLIDRGFKGAFYPTMYIEEKASIPIAYRISKDNLMESMVSISSLMKNLKLTSACVLCVLCNSSDKIEIDKQLSRIRKRYNNMDLLYFNIPDDEKYSTYDGMLLYGFEHIPYNKAIFMASNTVCKGDLTGFFRSSVDDYAIAGAKKYNIISNGEPASDLYKRGLKDLHHYIDCGVMLVNLNRLRQYDLICKLSKAYDGKLSIEELINAICYDQIRSMPIRQNFSTAYYELVAGKYIPKQELFVNYPKEELLRANNTALILKYDVEKPWLDSNCFRAKDWFYHESLCPLYDDLESGKVSIVMPIYNTEKYIEHTISSIVKQTYGDFELICVNDGSTDGTLELLNKCAKKDKRIKIIDQPNSGAGMARNNGLKYVTGEYVLILDSDDLYAADMIEKLVNKAKETKAEIVFCRAVAFNTTDGSEQAMDWSLLTDKIPSNPFAYYNLGPYLYSFTKGWAWDKLYATKLILRSGLRFQNLQNTNDAFFVFSMLTRASSMAYVEDILVRHRKNDASSISNNRVKNWQCFYSAISEIKHELINTGVYKKVERAFVNWVLNFTLWYTRTEPYPLKNQLYLLLKCAIFNEFNINGHPQEYFINKEDYELYLTIQSIPVDNGIKDAISLFYKDYQKFDAEILNDYVRLDLAGMEIKRLKRGGSISPSGTTVPIVLSCNQNYAKYTAVAIQSIIENIGQYNKYEIYVLHTELTEDVKRKLEDIKGRNYFVKCINVQKYLPSANELFVNEHITKEAYYRFCIPEVIQRPKIIYLDCDVVVLDDIAKLFACETGDAAISGVNNFMNKNVYYYIKDTLKIDPARYINSGVLIINSKKYVEADIKAKFLKLVKNNYRFLDQDIINIICKDKITLLPDRWNYQWHNHNEKNVLMLKQAEYDLTAKDPAILHFTTRRKAWNTPNWTMADRFWYYASHTVFFDEIISANIDAVRSAKYDVRKVPDWKNGGPASGLTQEKLDQLQSVYDEEIERLVSKLKKVEYDLNSINNSVSFRIGRSITWFPRKIRGGLRCLKHNGLAYTLIRVFRGKNKAEAYKKRKPRKIKG